MELKMLFIFIGVCLIPVTAAKHVATQTNKTTAAHTTTLPPPTPTPLPILNVCFNLGAHKFVELIINRHDSYLRKLILDSSGYHSSLSAFAFTDEAFSNAPPEVQNMSGEELEWLLQYHFAPGFAGNFGSQQDYLYPSLFPSPVSGSPPPQNIRINRYDINGTNAKPGFQQDKVLTATGATIVKADIPASNGVVHLIDKVMYPIPYGSDIPEFITHNPDLSTLHYYLKNSSILSSLATPPATPLTLFAPTDVAFSKLTQAQKDKLKDKDTLSRVLTYHIINSALYHAGMYDYQKLKALSGDTILVKRGVGGTSVAGKMITHFDITVTNGVIFKLAEVMFPPGV